MEKPRYEKLMTLNRIEANNLKKNNFYNLYFQCCIFDITFTTW